MYREMFSFNFDNIKKNVSLKVEIAFPPDLHQSQLSANSSTIAN